MFRTKLAYQIGNIIYGANDGIITTFAVVAAAAGAGVSSTIILILGIANLMADGFSMGASKYLSLKSEQSAGTSSRNGRSPLVDSLTTFVAFVAAGTLPLVPFLAPSAAYSAFTVSAIATGLSFFLVGASRSIVIKKNPIAAGVEMLIVGGLAASIAYIIGSFVERLVS